MIPVPPDLVIPVAQHVPNRQSLSLAFGWPPVASFLGELAVYALLYAALFVGGASWLFRKRDLT